MSSWVSISRVLARLACLFYLLGLASMENHAETNRLKVLTSFFPVYCVTVNVVGPLADVENLLPSGIGPHEFQFSPKDMRRVSRADVIVLNGLGLESWLEDAITKLKRQPAPFVVRLSGGLTNELISEVRANRQPHAGENTRRSGVGQDSKNPHLWLDPLLMAHSVTNLLQVLKTADPAHASAYETRAQAFLKRLQILDEEFRQALSPVRSRSFITYHQAFPYLIRRYGLTLAGVIEEVPDVDPSPRHLAALSKIIRDQAVRVIFIEPLGTSRLALQLGRDHGIPVAELDTLEFGPLEAGAYEDKMRENLSVLVKYLH